MLLDFVQDVFFNGSVTLIALKPEDTQQLVEAGNKFSLDFDDAYQCIAAEQHGLVVVSFDSDLDRTTRGKKTPAEILAESNVANEE